MKEYSLLFLVLVFLAFPQCKPENDSDSTIDTPSVTVTTGTSKEYSINSTSSTIVKDEITGLSFQFPQGGSGKLTVAALTEAPALGVTAKKFTVNFTGSTTIQLLAPNTTNEIGILYFYGSMTKASINGKNLQTGWWQVSDYTETTDQLVYTLNSPNSTLKAAAKNMYAFESITKNSTDAEKYALIKTTVGQVIDTWINAMPSDLATTARARINGNYKYNVSLSGDGSSYLAGNSSIFRNCNFYFKLSTVELRTIAHEVGHYICHVLLGYDKYMEIYGKFPSDWIGCQISHDPGDNNGRNAGTLEDYAYFSEYLITGAVDMGYDFSSVKKLNNFADMTNNAFPKDIDYPGSEGYSTAMLVALQRKTDLIYCFDKAWGQTKVPVVNASTQDVIAILAKGPRDVNETRTFIQSYLDSKGNSYKFNLSPMMEPFGWSYNGQGKIVDKAGIPVEGAKAQVVYQDYNKEYRTFESPKTGKDGVFALPRVFPGTSILKVFANNDSVQNAVTINWTEPTNKGLNMGNFVIDLKKVPIAVSLGGTTLTLLPAATTTGNPKIQHFSNRMTATRTSGTITHTAEISWLTPPSGNLEIVEGKTFMNQAITFKLVKTSSGGNASFDGCQIFVNNISSTSSWYHDWQQSNEDALGFTAPSVQRNLPASTSANTATTTIDLPVKMSLTDTGGPAPGMDGVIEFSGAIRNFWSSGDNVQFTITYKYSD